jgi:quinoprotein glucose dehydrogenase
MRRSLAFGGVAVAVALVAAYALADRWIWRDEPIVYLPAYPEPQDTAGVVVRAEPGLEVSLWASLPGSPVAINFAGSGAAYVAQTVRRREADLEVRPRMTWLEPDLALESIEQKRAFLRDRLDPALSEQNQWLPDFNQDGVHDWRDLEVPRERVLRVLDLTGDGVADSLNVYAEGQTDEVTGVAGGVLYHEGDVFLAMAPDLWRLSSRRSRGRVEGHESISHGYAVRLGISGHGMSGLTLGPDGKIYWKIADTGLNVVGPDGRRWSYPHEGAILRANPDGSEFEVFARGTRNIHEMAFDEHGNLIGVDNNADIGDRDRIVYLVDGGDSGWRNRYQWTQALTAELHQDDAVTDVSGYNVWLEERLWEPHFAGQAAHITPPVASFGVGPAGLAYNPGTALDESWRGYFFLTEFTGAPDRSRIVAFRIEPQGASFRLAEDRPVLSGILGTSLDFGPDGALYVADWVSGWVVRDRGRIWKVDAAEAAGSPLRAETRALLSADFRGRSVGELGELLRHADLRVRLQAQFELVRRGRRGAEELLRAATHAEHQLARLHGIWGTGQLARRESRAIEALLPLLRDADTEVRAQVARVIGDAGPAAAADPLLPLLADPSARVRFFAAQALGRLGDSRAVTPLVEMLEANADQDPYLRHAGALALSRIGDTDAIRRLRDHRSRAGRLAAVVALRHLQDPGVAAFLADADPLVVVEAARAIHDDDSIEAALPQLAQLLEGESPLEEPVLRRAVNANFRLGGPAEAERLAAFAARTDAPPALRAQALDALGYWPQPPRLDRVEGKYRPLSPRDAAAARRALAAVFRSTIMTQPDTVRIAAVEAAGKVRYSEAAPALHELVQQPAQPRRLRLAALTALGEIRHDRFPDAVRLALRDPDPELRTAAQRMVSELPIPPEQAAQMLAIPLEQGAIRERQAALATLARLDTPRAREILARWMDRLHTGTVPAELQLDVLLAAERSGGPELTEKLARYRAARPADDALAAFSETLAGGDPAIGRQLFLGHAVAECARCHAPDAGGGPAGPDLTRIGAVLDRRELLRSLVDPAARISPGYGSVRLRLNDGRELAGLVVGKSADTVVLQRAGGESLSVAHADVVERSAASPMPPMGEVLTASEIRDLIAYLATLR